MTGWGKEEVRRFVVVVAMAVPAFESMLEPALGPAFVPVPETVWVLASVFASVSVLASEFVSVLAWVLRLVSVLVKRVRRRVLQRLRVVKGKV